MNQPYTTATLGGLVIGVILGITLLVALFRKRRPALTTERDLDLLGTPGMELLGDSEYHPQSIFYIDVKKHRKNRRTRRR